MQGGARYTRIARQNQWWLWGAQAMTIGYEAGGRTFAYLGLFPLKLFLGEMFLGWFMVTRRDAFDWFFMRARRSRYVELLRIAMICFLLYGLGSLLIGCVSDNADVFAAFQNLAFNYYTLYLVIGIWLGVTMRLKMGQFALWLGWIHGLYGVAWVLLLNRLSFQIPGTPGVDLFGQPTGAAISIMVMLAFEPRVKKIIFPCLLNLFVMVGVQVRSEWLGFLAAFLIWSILARKISQLIAIIAITVMLAMVALFFDLKMEGTSNRGGEVSVQGVIGRIIAPFDPKTAAKYVDDAEGLGGTAEWRQKWWSAIYTTINTGPPRVQFFGEGYGFDITSVVDYVEGGIRTPHSIFFYTLCYGGWVGVAVFAFFQLTIASCLYKAYRLTGQAFGVSFWILCMTMALLGNQLETPFGAIPFYLLIGMALKPLFTPREMWEEQRVRRLARQPMMFQPQMAYPMVPA